MDAPLSAALARRLAAYSATAGVALAVAPEAGAQIVYYDFEPDIVTCAAYGLDFDDDGVTDLRVAPEGYPAYGCYFYGRTYTYFMAIRRPAGADLRNGILGYDLLGAPDGYGVAARFSSGEVIGPLVGNAGFYTYALLASSQGGLGVHIPFDGLEGYAGVRFIGGDGELRYGWLRLFVRASATYATLYEFAYESSPDTPIAAGGYDVALRGSIERRRFPPEGGLLRATVTIENSTPVALPLDLWFEAEHEGGAVSTGRFGSGTLAPWATATRRIAFEIQPEVAAGAYDVRVKVGRQSTNRVVSFKRFRITKEPGTGEAGVGGALVASAIPGDLFASTEVNAAGLAATHALGEPVPNPATGQAALTLQVAEAQAVRVEVLDALGRRVALLHDGPMAPGEAHRLVFDGSGLPAGVYVVRAIGEAFADARVLTLTR